MSFLQKNTQSTSIFHAQENGDREESSGDEKESNGKNSDTGTSRRGIFHASNSSVYSDNSDDERDDKKSNRECETTGSTVFNATKSTVSSKTGSTRPYSTDTDWSDGTVSRRSSRPTTRGTTGSKTAAPRLGSEGKCSTADTRRSRKPSRASPSARTQRRVRLTKAKEGTPYKPGDGQKQDQKTKAPDDRKASTVSGKISNKPPVDTTKPSAKSRPLPPGSRKPSSVSRIPVRTASGITGPDKRNATLSSAKQIRMEDKPMKTAGSASRISRKTASTKEHPPDVTANPCMPSSESSVSDGCQTKNVKHSRTDTPASQGDIKAPDFHCSKRATFSSIGDTNRESVKTWNSERSENDSYSDSDFESYRETPSTSSRQDTYSEDDISSYTCRKPSGRSSGEDINKYRVSKSHRRTSVVSSEGDTYRGSDLMSFRKASDMSSTQDTYREATSHSHRKTSRDHTRRGSLASSRKTDTPASVEHGYTYKVNDVKVPQRCRLSASVSQESVTVLELSYEETPVSPHHLPLPPGSPYSGTGETTRRTFELDEEEVASMDLTILGHKIATPECLSPPSGYMTPTSTVSSLSSVRSSSPQTPKAYVKARLPLCKDRVIDEARVRKVKKHNLAKRLPAGKMGTRNIAPKEGLKLPQIQAPPGSPAEAERKVSRRNKTEDKEDAEPLDRLALYKAMKKQLYSFN